MTIENDVLSREGYWSAHKPDWANWERTSHCPLWIAVALACDVDPEIYMPHGLPAEITADFGLTPVPPKAQELLSLAKSAVASGSMKLRPKDGATVMQREVNTSEFTSWLQVLGHKTPTGFTWTAKELVAGSHTWPWGKYQTKDLQILAMAADKFWKNYVPGDPSTAPRSAQVIAWLKEQGVSERPAKAMASILRADDLPSGRRQLE